MRPSLLSTTRTGCVQPCGHVRAGTCGQLCRHSRSLALRPDTVRRRYGGAPPQEHCWVRRSCCEAVARRARVQQALAGKAQSSGAKKAMPPCPRGVSARQFSSRVTRVGKAARTSFLCSYELAGTGYDLDPRWSRERGGRGTCFGCPTRCPQTPRALPTPLLLSPRASFLPPCGDGGGQHTAAFSLARSGARTLSPSPEAPRGAE